LAALFSRHSLALQTSYSEVKRQASEQPSALIGTPGSVSVREVKDNRFYYRQFYDAEGNKAAAYIGPVGDPAAEGAARDLRARIEATNAIVKEVRLLAQNGYTRVDARTGAILAAFSNNGLFRGGAVLVGSHAYGVLLNDLGVRAAAYGTEDIDLARGAPLVLDRPLAFEAVLAESTVRLSGVPGLDRKAPVTSYKARGKSALRVDLLTPTSGRDVSTRAVPELKGHAAALPHLAYLLTKPVESVALGREGAVPVRVPRPEAFVWHKALVSQARGATSDKKNKDVLQACVLFAVLAEEATDSLLEAFGELPRTAAKLVRRSTAAMHARLDAGGHVRATELLAELTGAHRLQHRR
jgi:hypothetical protein